jgi:hypothetical protein
MSHNEFNNILGQQLHKMREGNYFSLFQFISVKFLVGLPRVNDQCDVVLLVRALLMVIALHTKDPEQKQEALQFHHTPHRG